MAANRPIYFLGDLAAGEGVRLSANSVTDLAGVAIVNPRASPQGGAPRADFVDGKVIGGGALISAGAFFNGGSLFRTTYGQSVYAIGYHALHRARNANLIDPQARPVRPLLTNQNSSFNKRPHALFSEERVLSLIHI